MFKLRARKVLRVTPNFRENFCGLCFICIESAAIVQKIYMEIFAIHQNSASFSLAYVAFVVYGTVCAN